MYLNLLANILSLYIPALKYHILTKNFNVGEIESWIAFDEEKNTWKCLMCGKGTGLRKDNIRRHFKIQHMENPRVECHVCHGIYKNETSLRQHMYTHM